LGTFSSGAFLEYKLSFCFYDKPMREFFPHWDQQPML
jgi:hypothetical protein